MEIAGFQTIFVRHVANQHGLTEEQKAHSLGSQASQTGAKRKFCPTRAWDFERRFLFEIKPKILGNGADADDETVDQRQHGHNDLTHNRDQRDRQQNTSHDGCRKDPAQRRGETQVSDAKRACRPLGDKHPRSNADCQHQSNDGCDLGSATDRLCCFHRSGNARTGSARRFKGILHRQRGVHRTRHDAKCRKCRVDHIGGCLVAADQFANRQP